MLSNDPKAKEVTTFKLIESSEDRLFLYIHTEMANLTVELDRETDDLDRLKNRLDMPPAQFEVDD
jgi:hypothetical protein